MRYIKVIPNKNVFDIPPHHNESNTKYHAELLKEFCDSIGIDYSKYRTVYDCLLNYDFIIITIVDTKYALTMLPKNISSEQCTELLKLEKFYKTFKDLEFLDFFSNGLGAHSDKKNSGHEVLQAFYKSLKTYQIERINNNGRR